MNKKETSVILRYPAMRWQDACPVGSGTTGAMLYGHIRNEQILLNRERLWNRRPRPELADVSDLLDKVRDLLHAGEYGEARDLLPDALQERNGPGRRPDPFLPLGWLHMDCSKPEGIFTNYRRGIDLQTAQAWVSWKMGENSMFRRCFVSRDNDVMAVEQSAKADVLFDATVAFDCKDRFHQAESQFAAATTRNSMGHEASGDAPVSLPVTVETTAEGDFFQLAGRTESGVEYGMVGKVVASGTSAQSSTQPGGRICVENAEKILLLIGTYADEPADNAIRRIKEHLNDLPQDYEALLRPHVGLHGELFNRCKITLCDGDDGQMPNEDLLAAAYGGQVPDALLERMYHFGRYLLICSTGELPANLQGVWNGDFAPAWESDYHNDENIQMNYWQAGPGDMPELLLPLIQYYCSFMGDYRENARKLYGAGGILLPIVQTTHALAYSSPWVYWTAAAGWMGQHFFDYYSFTGDRQVLEKDILPWLTGCLEFYEDFLIEDEAGNLEFCPSLSPENTPLPPEWFVTTINATMDVAVCREVLGNLKRTCDILGGGSDLKQRCDRIITRLPAYEINEDGAICEWIHQDLPDNYHHRHQSHIYPVFPGLEVTEESNPEIFEACRTAVEKRLVIGLTSQTGWSMAHMANIYARLGEGDRALQCLDILTRAETGPNLLTYHNDWRGMGLSMAWLGTPPFQIDAIFGLSAAMIEMLLISTPTMIKLLPALPKRWQKGSVDRIACRGGTLAALEWDQQTGELTVDLCSRHPRQLTLCLPNSIETIEPCVGEAEITESPLGDRYRVVDMPAGQSIRLSIRMKTTEVGGE